MVHYSKKCFAWPFSADFSTRRSETETIRGRKKERFLDRSKSDSVRLCVKRRPDCRWCGGRPFVSSTLLL
ncbi:hypothetical protein CEXT_42891 [Caerostris extrusa]|uniref:Uncharacterized protein n=1 Tax=Caerostris extrusa TaxID=172846 RepID=A0AAV4TVV3_CAEEX|nr:hypothetical protein CEXT_42891 [Caerostris extrusa]